MKYKSLLNDKNILIVNKELAEAVGLSSSIVLRQIAWWLDINETADKKSHYHEGLWWCYNAYSDWEKEFTWWSRNTIIDAIKWLESLGLIIGVSRFNKRKSDETRWYTIDPFYFDHFLDLWLHHEKPCYNAKPSQGVLYWGFINQWRAILPPTEVRQGATEVRYGGYQTLVGGLPNFGKALPEDTKETEESTDIVAALFPSEPPKAKEPKQPKPLSEYQLFIKRVGEIAGKDMTLKTVAKRTGVEASELWSAGYRDSHLDKFLVFWETFWKSKGNTKKPTLVDLKEHMKQAQEDQDQNIDLGSYNVLA